MTSRYLSLLVALFAVSLVGCQTSRPPRFFVLENERTHETLGPYVLSDRTKVKIQKGTYQIKELADSDEVLRFVLENEVVPEFCLENVSVASALSFFQECLPRAERGSGVWYDWDRVPKIHFSESAPYATREIERGCLMDVTLWQALMTIAQEADLSVRIEYGDIWISSKLRR